MRVQLIHLDDTWRNAFVAMADDYRAAGEPRYETAVQNFTAYLEQLAAASRPEQTDIGWP